MLRYDPVPWLRTRDEPAAVRARRRLGLDNPGDTAMVMDIVARLASTQDPNGSFAGSVLGTACAMVVLADLCAVDAGDIVARATEHLFNVLADQPGYPTASDIEPGELRAPEKLGGFFGPYADRALPDIMAAGAWEMNEFRAYEPLRAPHKPVHEHPLHAGDRAGPGSCYAWGLVPLAYVVEGLARSGYGADKRLRPAVAALLGAQRESGGWCRNLAGHPGCTLPALRALAVHPEHRRSDCAARGLAFLGKSCRGTSESATTYWRGMNVYLALDTAAGFDLPVARDIIAGMLPGIVALQKPDGSFRSPCAVEKVAAVISAVRALDGATEAHR